MRVVIASSNRLCVKLREHIILPAAYLSRQPARQILHSAVAKGANAAHTASSLQDQERFIILQPSKRPNCISQGKTLWRCSPAWSAPERATCHLLIRRVTNFFPISVLPCKFFNLTGMDLGLFATTGLCLAWKAELLYEYPSRARRLPNDKHVIRGLLHCCNPQFNMRVLPYMPLMTSIPS